MSHRANIAGFLLFILLAAIIVLQILSMVRSDRIYIALNKIERSIEGDNSQVKPQTLSKSAGETYPGDDGDWLIWAFRVEPKTLNQINVDTDIYSQWITELSIYEPLMAYDYDTMRLKPHLAERCEVSDDGLEITFYLRDDVYFSDGVPITADDVIFTYQTVIDPNVDAANLANLYVDVDRAEKINDRVVKFYMKRPYFKALEVLSFWNIGIYPKHIYQFKDAKEFNKRVSEPIGSGPYVFERWDVGNQIVLRRNENYWGRKPHIKKIVYKFINNSIAAAQALKAHQVDIIVAHDSELFANFDADEEFKKEFSCLACWNPGVPFYYIGWNEDSPLFSDSRVRRAMTLNINREQIISKLLKGYGEAVTGPFYIKGTQNDTTIKPLPYDPEKAKQLLDDAGWIDRDGDGIREKDGVVFRFRFSYAAGDSLYERLAVLLKDEMAKIGVDVIPEPYEWSALLPRITERKFDAMILGWGGDIVEDNYPLFHSSQIGKGGYNYIGFRNSEADVLLEQIRRTIDVGQQDVLCHRLHRILYDQQPFTFLFVRPTFRLVDKRFENVKIHNLGLNFLEWYVPKEKQRYK
ncbi:MAG: peptide-binding protein [Sedimentisphaerales bacterium]